MFFEVVRQEIGSFATQSAPPRPARRAIAPDLGEDHGRYNAMLKRRFKIYAEAESKLKGQTRSIRMRAFPLSQNVDT